MGWKSSIHCPSLWIQLIDYPSWSLQITKFLKLYHTIFAKKYVTVEHIKLWNGQTTLKLCFAYLMLLHVVKEISSPGALNSTYYVKWELEQVNNKNSDCGIRLGFTMCNQYTCTGSMPEILLKRFPTLINKKWVVSKN